MISIKNTIQRVAYVLVGFAFLLVIPGIAETTDDSAGKRVKPATRVIELAAQVSYSNERAHITKLLKAFERSNPETQLKVRFFRGDASSQFNLWLDHQAGPEVFYWYGGKQIDRLAKQGRLKDLSSVWEKHELKKHFETQGRETVTSGKREFGIPIAQYSWSLFYRESVLKRKKVALPETWESLLRACRTTASPQHRFLALGSKEAWALNAWFDYLVLRLHGIEFYRALLSGSEDWRGAQVREVFTHFKQLIDAECFDLGRHAFVSVNGMLPRLYQGLNSVALVGGFVVADLPTVVEHDFSVGEFPRIREGMPMHTVSPADAYVVANYANLDRHLEKLLVYFSSEEFQSGFTQETARLPMNIQARSKVLNPLQIQTLTMNDDGFTQYLDRESHPLLALYVSAAMASFLDHQNVDRAVIELSEEVKTFFKKRPLTLDEF